MFAIAGANDSQVGAIPNLTLNRDRPSAINRCEAISSSYPQGVALLMTVKQGAIASF
ncbi:hypothetical protein [Phormidesmis priestleyi]